jgi:branched-chain amino acid transport system permease protein
MVFQYRILSRVRGDPGLFVLVTFALAITLEGIMGALWQSTGRSVRTEYTGEVIRLTLLNLNLRLPVVRVIGCVAAVAVLVFFHTLLQRSNLGRAIRATIQNSTAAQLVGVNVTRVQAVAFGLGLAAVAAGGSIFSLIWTFNSGSHEEWIAKMLAIIVLGGMGSLPGALIAALIMGVTESVASVTLTTYLSPIVFYVILFLVLIFRPQGLLGARLREG